MAHPPDVITIGETMALVLADHPGVPQRGSRFSLSLGGAESNVAIGLARLGHHAMWVSALGADALGDMIVSTLEAEGVLVSARRESSHPTGMMMKTPSRGDYRFVSYYRSTSAATTLSEADCEDLELRNPRIVHLSGITPALSASAAAMVSSLAKRMKARGTLVSFDINYRAALWSRSAASAFCTDILPSVDLLFGNAEELALIAGEGHTELSVLEQVSAQGPSSVVMKQGKDGATALLEGSVMSQEAFEVDVVDTVGAGDGFVAGYLSALLDGLDATELLARAAWCGAQVCRDLGDWEGAARRADMPSLLDGARS